MNPKLKAVLKTKAAKKIIATLIITLLGGAGLTLTGTHELLINALVESTVDEVVE